MKKGSVLDQPALQLIKAQITLLGGCGGGLVDRAVDLGPCDPSSIPLGEKKENKRKEAGVGP